MQGERKETTPAARASTMGASTNPRLPERKEPGERAAGHPGHISHGEGEVTGARGKIQASTLEHQHPGAMVARVALRYPADRDMVSVGGAEAREGNEVEIREIAGVRFKGHQEPDLRGWIDHGGHIGECRVLPDGPCLLYTSDAADDLTRVDLGGRRIIKK